MTRRRYLVTLAACAAAGLTIGVIAYVTAPGSRRAGVTTGPTTSPVAWEPPRSVP